MPQPFDITTKRLFDADPRAWLTLAGLPTSDPITLVDPTLPASSVLADKAARVDATQPGSFHLELQASYDPLLPERLLNYGARLSIREHLPIRSILLLLRPSADGPTLRGTLDRRPDAQGEGLLLSYRVIRLFDLPVEQLMNSPLATLPLAPLARGAAAHLPAILEHLGSRVRREAPPAEALELLVATYTLLGLRYDRSVADQLLRGVREMHESVTYQAIIEEGEARGRVEGEVRGRVDGERRLLFILAEHKLGPAAPRARAWLEQIDDLAELEALAQRLLRVSSWVELLEPA